MFFASRVKKIIGLSALAAAALGTGVAIQRNGWDVSTIGVMRFGRAAFTIGGIAIDYKLSLMGLEAGTSEYIAVKSKTHQRSADKLLQLCCINGGAFIKVGQHIGAMEYILPGEYVNTLKVLHCSAPTSSTKDILNVVKQDLKRRPDFLFSSFESEPIGAASLAQVHKATLHDGTVVAVKVQHPNVKGHSYVDIKTMELLVNMVAAVFPDFKFLWLADELKTNLPRELDFIQEGKNAELAHQKYSKYEWLKIPKIYWEWSSSRVLTMEYCDGGQINDRQYMIDHNINMNMIFDRLGKLYSEMIFVQGYVHCDPHPGNILVQACSNGPKIILLDHGLYANLSESFRLRYCKLWLSILSANVDKIKENAKSLGIGDMYGLMACMVASRSWESIQKGITKKRASEKEYDEIKANAAKFLPLLTEVLDQIPREMILILKTNDLLRAIEFNLSNKQGEASFISMTLCCLQAFHQYELKLCKSRICVVKSKVYNYWAQFKVKLYNMYLQFMADFVPHF